MPEAMVDGVLVVQEIIDVNSPLTTEEQAEIAALANRPIIPDEECPELSDAEIAFYDYLNSKYQTRHITKEIVLSEMAHLVNIMIKQTRTSFSN